MRPHRLYDTSKITQLEVITTDHELHSTCSSHLPNQRPSLLSTTPLYASFSRLPPSHLRAPSFSIHRPSRHGCCQVLLVIHQRHQRHHGAALQEYRRRAAWHSASYSKLARNNIFIFVSTQLFSVSLSANKVAADCWRSQPIILSSFRFFRARVCSPQRLK